MTDETQQSTKPLEFTIEDIIARSGLLNSTFTDYKGRTQPRPIIQRFEFDEDELEDDQRCLCIRNVGSGTGDFLVREPSMSIMVFSKARKGDIGVTKHYAELIKNHLSTDFTEGCIMSVNIIGDTAGPYNLASGRRYFELNLQVITTTGLSN